MQLHPSFTADVGYTPWGPPRSAEMPFLGPPYVFTATFKQGCFKVVLKTCWTPPFIAHVSLTGWELVGTRSFLLKSRQLWPWMRFKTTRTAFKTALFHTQVLPGSSTWNPWEGISKGKESPFSFLWSYPYFCWGYLRDPCWRGGSFQLLIFRLLSNNQEPLPPSFSFEKWLFIIANMPNKWKAGSLS